jgi:hypothetical protein
MGLFFFDHLPGWVYFRGWVKFGGWAYIRGNTVFLLLNIERICDITLHFSSGL